MKKRFLANPDIAKEYRHATVAEAYRPGNIFKTIIHRSIITVRHLAWKPRSHDNSSANDFVSFTNYESEALSRRTVRADQWIVLNSEILKTTNLLNYFLVGYYEALKKFTLKKFLLLILFLDKAKLTRLIDHDPCLFNKDAQFKVLTPLC